jgi:3-oxoacyl-[acyl-carrier protein] reductase
MVLARLLAPKIHVNAVTPGFIDGRWMQEGPSERHSAFRESFALLSALGRVRQPKDTADAIVIPISEATQEGRVG